MSRAAIRATFAALLLLCAVVLFVVYDPTLLSNDTAQYLSVARHIAAGDGAVTDLIYYQSHFEIGGVPVTQTIFPPGYPALIAGVTLLGIDARLAAHICNVLAFALTAWFLHLLLRQRGHTTLICAVLPLLWLASGVAWHLVLIAKSDIVFTLLQVAAAYSFARALSGPRPRSLALVGAGALAAAAFAVRYQGLFFIAALGSYFIFDACRPRRWQPVRAAALFGLAPAVVVAVVFVHNLQLTGHVSGGHVSVMQHGSSPLVAFAALANEVSTLTGFSWSGLRSVHWRETLLLLWAIGMAALVVAGARSRGSHAARVARIDGLVWACAANTAITCGAVLWLALTRSPGYIQERYLLPLLPFVLLLAAEMLRIVAARIASPRALALAGAATLAIIAAGQTQVFAQQFARHVVQNRGRAVSLALAAARDGEDVAGYLRERTSRTHPLLATYGQVVGATLRVPALELTPALFSRTTWNEPEVRGLIRRYGVRYVLLLPRLYRGDARQFANQPFLRELRAGVTPAWLTECLRKDDVWLFAVRGSSDCQ